MEKEFDYTPIFQERDGMRAVNGKIDEATRRQYEENKLNSLKRREIERKARQHRNDIIIRKVAAICLAASIIIGVPIHIKNADKVKTTDSTQVAIDYTGKYTDQGKQIYHDEKNWYIENNKQTINASEVAKDLSLLSEANRKYALYDITEEMDYTSVWLDDFKSAENKKNLDRIVDELGKLVGRSDTNYTNVEGINDVIIRYGYKNYNEFAKACKDQIELWNSIIETEPKKGA